MARTDPTFVAGDGLSTLRVQFRDQAGAVKDLTGLTPKLTFNIVDPDDPTVVLQASVTVTMTVFGVATNGLADYLFTKAQLLGGTAAELTGGRMHWEAYAWDGSDAVTSRLEHIEWLRGRILVAT